MTRLFALTQAQLDSRSPAAALQRWTEAGLSAEQAALLKAVTIEVKKIAGGRLGEASQGHIFIAENGAGYGWYVAAHPLENAEFSVASSATRFYTDSQNTPAGHLDLFTAVMHEMGHQLGLQDSYKLADRENLMYGSLTMGERRLPARGQANGAVPHLVGGIVNFLGETVIVNIGTLPIGKTVTIKFDAAITATPASPYSTSNTSQVSGTNITGSPISSPE